MEGRYTKKEQYVPGVFNFSPEAGKTDTVEQAEFRAMDRRKAWKIIIYSVIIGAVVAIAAYYLPPGGI